jgi:hypothetical protein
MVETKYFERAGPENTEETIEIARKRVKELDIKYIVVASLTGDSAIKVAKAFEDLNVKIVCVTLFPGMSWNLKRMDVGPFAEVPSLREIRDEWRKSGKKEIPIEIVAEKRTELENLGVEVIRGTVPLFDVSFSIRRHLGLITPQDLIAKTLELFSTGTLVCAETAMMAVDAGILPAGEEIVTMAGTERGLDTALVVKSSLSADMFKPKEGLRFLEVLAKPKRSVLPDKQVSYLK